VGERVFFHPVPPSLRVRVRRTLSRFTPKFEPGASARKIRHSALSSTDADLTTAYVHAKHRGKARVAVFGYHAKICLLAL
jgi:hypothetical protein